MSQNGLTPSDTLYYCLSGSGTDKAIYLSGWNDNNDYGIVLFKTDNAETHPACAVVNNGSCESVYVANDWTIEQVQQMFDDAIFFTVVDSLAILSDTFVGMAIEQG